MTVLCILRVSQHVRCNIYLTINCSNLFAEQFVFAILDSITTHKSHESNSLRLFQTNVEVRSWCAVVAGLVRRDCHFVINVHFSSVFGLTARVVVSPPPFIDTHHTKSLPPPKTKHSQFMQKTKYQKEKTKKTKKI